MERRRVAGIGAIVLLLGGGSAPDAVAQQRAAQGAEAPRVGAREAGARETGARGTPARPGPGCTLEFALGIAVPLDDPPEGTGHTSGLQTSGGGHVGVACDALPSLRLGAELEAYSLKRLLLAHLAGTIGVELPLSDGSHAAWLGLTGKLGLAGSHEYGARPAILREGRHLKLNSLGLAAAGAVRYGVPIGARSAVIVEASLHARFLPTKRVPGERGAGLTSVVTLPISLGFRIGL